MLLGWKETTKPPKPSSATRPIDHAPFFIPEEIIYAPPHLGPEGIFQGRGGGGVYFEAPRGRNCFHPPLSIYHTPPTPRRVISGVGDGGV